MPVLELAYQVPNVDGDYLKRQEFITVTKCFESTEQERIRAKTKRKGSMLVYGTLYVMEEVSSGRSRE